MDKRFRGINEATPPKQGRPFSLMLRLLLVERRFNVDAASRNVRFQLGNFFPNLR